MYRPLIIVNGREARDFTRMQHTGPLRQMERNLGIPRNTLYLSEGGVVTSIATGERVCTLKSKMYKQCR
jgi:hypothetical protein